MIVLSDDFYKELVTHRVPSDLEAVKLLAGSPAVLDLYMWLSYRCFKAKRVEEIPLFGEFGLAHQIGTVEYSRPRRFRAMLEQWLANIRAIWPECPAHQFRWTEDDPRPGHIDTTSGGQVCLSPPPPQSFRSG